MATKTSLKIKKLRKALSNKYKTVDQINNRLEEMINQELKRDLTPNEELEFVELKRVRNKINPEYKFFG